MVYLRGVVERMKSELIAVLHFLLGVVVVTYILAGLTGFVLGVFVGSLGVNLKKYLDQKS